MPVINPPWALLRAAKSTAAELLGRAGVRTARTHRIGSARELEVALDALGCPLIVREDWGHQGPIFRFDARAEVTEAPTATQPGG